MTAALLAPPSAIDTLIAQTLAHIPAPNTRRAYSRHIKVFAASGHPLTRSGIGQHLIDCRARGDTAATNRQCIAALRLLAREAEMRRLLDPLELLGIERIKPDTLRGHKAGRWLTKDELQRLLALPDRTTLIGQRDAALLAVMAGCGLRREEAASLCWVQYRDRDGRKVLIDILGKGQKYRQVPVSHWVARELDRLEIAMSMWSASGPTSRIFQGQLRRIEGFHGSLTPDGIYWLVRDYSKRLGIDFAPHDLRRTFARLLKQSGADLDQIKYLMGHSSIATTEIYLGSSVELRPGLAAVDKLVLEEIESNETK
jgi:integrase